MLLYLLIAIILWFVAPLLIDGHVKKRKDKKAYKILCRIVSIAFVIIAFSKILI